jgi:predicted ATP-binding protein involved in virulence
MENSKLFLKEVTLSGYKSINAVTIQFQKGLNIIIGKNAAGKTNFLEFLNKTLSLEYKGLNNFSSILKFKNGTDVTIESNNFININKLLDPVNFGNEVESVLKISNKTIDLPKGSSFSEKLTENKILFDTTFLCHGIPTEYLIVDKPFSFKLSINDGFSHELMNVITNKSNPYFTRCFLFDILFSDFAPNSINDSGSFEVDFIKKSINPILKKTEEIKSILNKYSPIEDIRFSDNYNIFITEDNENFTITNFFIEFKINGSWLPFSNLSDGTKRLFYIISEVFENKENTNNRPISIGWAADESEISRIILIEEPELGIHPHQFHKLMEFLKEESEHKQIIITTHSPQSLDSINEDELNRIIIAYAANSKEGTKLRHLDETEIIKAKAYIKEDFLSDYWLYSDLEK